MEKVSILLVDDCESEFYLLQELFNRPECNYALSWEPSFDAALKLMASNSHDVYLIDYKLSSETGVELIGAAKSRGCASPIILLTGLEGGTIDEEAQRVGADDYLTKKELNYRYVEKSIRYALERKRSERNFVQQQLRLSHAMRMSALGELASGIAHEINNPLAIISGVAESLKKRHELGRLGNDDIPQSIEKIITMSDRISKIVNGLNSFSRNSDDDPFESANLSDLIRESIELCMGKIKLSRVQIEVSEGAESSMAQCHPGEIIQVIVNLVSNAVDAIKNQENPWIRIETECEGPFFRIRITDSGEGISSELREKILLPYFSTKESGKGTGLGLSICKMILESHSGQLAICENSPNTQFVVEIPLEQTNLASKVLIVDDEAHVRELLSVSFEDSGATTYIACNGEEAIEILSKHKVDVIITDINMPGISGLVLAGEIYEIFKESPQKPKLVVISGYTRAILPQKIQEIFETRTFTKPFDVDELIDHCLNESRESIAV